MSQSVNKSATRSLSILFLVAACGPTETSPPGETGTTAAEPSAPPPVTAEYVGRASCIGCHADQAASFAGSHHDLAMQPADETTVLGDFDDAVFEGVSGTTSFHREGDAFLVRTAGPDGTVADFPVRWVFGVDPLQQVLIELDEGRVQCLTVAWDSVRERWYDLYPEEVLPAGDELHWAGRYQRWNAMCAACHSTDLRKNYDAKTDGYTTTFAEIDVSCEACHGPGSEHLEWAATGDSADSDRGLTTLLNRDRPAAQIESCAPCHSRRSELVPDPEPGMSFLDAYVPERLHEGFYFPDGQIREEVYVWGSFAQSKMHDKGVACSDCHDPHSLELWVPGDAVCLQCHSEQAPLDRFPTLTAKAYATREHHHHPEDSEGARCVACHMPERTYMGIDARRDHSLRVPRPAVSKAFGTPDACTGCHGDQDLDWAIDRVAEWTGQAEDPMASFAAALVAGRRGEAEADGLLLKVVQDPEQTAIVRATALEQLAPWADRHLEVIRAQLADEGALVRYSAVRSLELLPLEMRAPLALSVMRDPVRAVRAEVGRVLADLEPGTLAGKDRVAFERTLEEYLAAQAAAGDLPAAHLNLGVHRERSGDADAALLAYGQALEHDPAFLPARFNVATLLAGLGRPEEARAILEAGLAHAPEEGELHYSLGLVLAELGEGSRAARHLTQAATLMPDRPRVQYNAGLAAQGAGWDADALRYLGRAHDLAPQEPDIVHALALFHAQKGEFAEALVLARRLLTLTRGAPWAQQLVAQLEADAGGR